FQPSAAQRREAVPGSPGWRSHRARLSQRRHPRAAARETPQAHRPTPSERCGRAPAKTTPCPPFGGEDPAQPPLAPDGSRQTAAGEDRPALLPNLARTRGIVNCCYPQNFSPSCAEVQEKESKASTCPGATRRPAF